jgi:hypothetical protein
MTSHPLGKRKLFDEGTQMSNMEEPDKVNRALQTLAHRHGMTDAPLNAQGVLGLELPGVMPGNVAERV